MATPARIAILASGQGSLMEAIADACDTGFLSATICLVISNVHDAPVLQRAQSRGLPTACIPHANYASRAGFEAALLAALRPAAPDLVALAGFMRILTNSFIGEYYGSLLNIHPSVLPKYPGLDTHQRALDAGDSEAGSSVHFVTPELDAGPIILQARVPVLPGDDARTLELRVKNEERRIYPLALRWCLQGDVALRDGRVWAQGAAVDNGLRNDRGDAQAESEA